MHFRKMILAVDGADIGSESDQRGDDSWVSNANPSAKGKEEPHSCTNIKWQAGQLPEVSWVRWRPSQIVWSGGKADEGQCEYNNGNELITLKLKKKMCNVILRSQNNYIDNTVSILFIWCLQILFAEL